MLYRRLGVERAARASALPRGRALRAMIAGQAAAFMKRSAMRDPSHPSCDRRSPRAASRRPPVAPDGQLVAAKYGKHASVVGATGRTATEASNLLRLAVAHFRRTGA
jgi:hypothetical protein